MLARDSVGYILPLLIALILLCTLLVAFGVHSANQSITRHLQEDIAMGTQEVINTLTTQLGKAKDEIVAKIADVQAQLDAASVPPEVVDLSALTAAAQALDDIVPDAPVEPPVETPVETWPPAPVEDIVVPVGENPTA